MKMRKRTAAVCAAWLAGAAFGGLPAVNEIPLEGEYAGHLQDVWFDGSALYWAHTDELVKTDLGGKVLVRKSVGGHHAGLEVRDGRLFSAVCAFNGEPREKTTTACHVMVGEYDAATLERIDMHVLDINDRAGSLAMLDDGSFLVGCLRPDDIRKDQVRMHHIGKDFKLIKSYVLDNVPVRLGIETIKKRGPFLYLNMYGGNPGTVKLSPDFKEVGRGQLFGQRGMVVDGTNLWVGVSARLDGKGPWVSKLVRKDCDEAARTLLFSDERAKRFQ